MAQYVIHSIPFYRRRVIPGARTRSLKRDVFLSETTYSVSCLACELRMHAPFHSLSFLYSSFIIGPHH